VRLGKRNLARWFFWPGLVLAILGSAYAFKNHYWYRTRTWALVETPLLLEAGSSGTYQFTPNVTERFLIRLEVDRDAPDDLTETVLGVSKPYSAHFGEVHGFKMRWAVFENGNLLKQGLSDGNGEEFWGAKKGRILGFFPATSGHNYRLGTTVLENGSALHPYHPTLAVAVDIFTLDGYAMGAGITELLGLIATGLGLGLIAVSILVWSWHIAHSARHISAGA
jgi:hypothetical protein